MSRSGCGGLEQFRCRREVLAQMCGIDAQVLGLQGLWEEMNPSNNSLECNNLPLCPTKHTWGDTGHSANVPGKVTLICEARVLRYFRQGKLSSAKHMLRVLNALLQHIAVRRHSDRLLERTREMMYRQAGHLGQHFQTHVLIEIGINVFANAMRTSGWEPTAI